MIPNIKYSNGIFTCSPLKQAPWRLHIRRLCYSLSLLINSKRTYYRDLFQVNYTKKHLFTQKSTSLENTAPHMQNSGSMLNKPVSYQAYCWKQALHMYLQIMNFQVQQTGTGARKLQSGDPSCMLSQKHQNHVMSLSTVACTKGFTWKCECVKATLKCTIPCFCSSDCLTRSFNKSTFRGLFTQSSSVEFSMHKVFNTWLCDYLCNK